MDELRYMKSLIDKLKLNVKSIPSEHTSIVELKVDYVHSRIVELENTLINYIDKNIREAKGRLQCLKK